MKILFLLLLSTIVIFAKPLVKTNYDFYDIYPINKHKLEDSMDQTSPLSNFGSIRHGTVYWKIRYRYKRERKAGICRIAEVKTLMDITYTVPKIPKTYKAPSGTRSVFNRYSEILLTYLKKNSDYAVLAGNEIEKELVKIKPFNNDCELIKVDAKRVATKIINKFKKKNKDFEIRTYEGFLDSVRTEKLL